jgi:hypothetical protein
MNNDKNMTIGRMHARPLQVNEIGEVAGAAAAAGHWTSATITGSSSGGGTVDGSATYDF